MNDHLCREFSQIGIPLVMYASWKDSVGKGAKLVIGSRALSLELSSQIPASHRESLLQVIGTVGDDLKVDSQTFLGGVALSFTAHLASLSRCISYDHLHPAGAVGDVMGMWGLPKNTPEGAGMLHWWTPESGYVVDIVHTKGEALSIVHSFQPWFSNIARLVQKVEGWSIARYSTVSARRITGSVAELLCKASVVENLNSGLR